MKYILFVAFCIAGAYATDFTDCGSDGYDISLYLEGCDEMPCIVQRGQSYYANITFTLDHDIDELTLAITANLGGINLPWPDLDTDACANLAEGATCPIPADTPTTWEHIADILPEYPAVSTLATIRLFHEPGHDDVCMQLLVTIISE